MAKMIVDLTVEVNLQSAETAKQNEKKAWRGHLGTHFDVMNKVFPLDYMERDAVVFDVGDVSPERDITAADIDLSAVREGMFVAFRTGFIEREGYGTKAYFTEHPQLSRELIGELLKRKVAIIAVDFAGIRRGKEHTPTDQLCADAGTFVVENLCNLSSVLDGRKFATFTAGTYPVNFTGMTGLPCRVVAKIHKGNPK